ncbi:hypothetical protein H8K90_15680 [Winogradskyella echinorum]|uniref:STAS/SEC14 domain-containing protein n=1 Tax=Winogradskyella echinorum TaxID=538189 RepID=A0ABR6Y519_9FLAO|nr:hypothetical protein [Winogradskyella echinorum]MBC3847837.1 hypothetical protein [Winogradskyella echinorum]MBC5752185.1 hypothetical protein [Winogradskyella echinorum]
MRFEDSPLSKTLSYKKIILDFATKYLFDDFFIMEVNEGVHFNSEKLNSVLDEIRNHYGDQKKLAYISNRVNSYSIDPVLWAYFDKDDRMLIAASIVSYTDATFMSANIEKQLSAISMKRSRSLEEAIAWVKRLSELN